MSLSTWDSRLAGRRKRGGSSLSPGHVTLEFDRTKRGKIFAHKLGAVNFSRNRDINAERDSVIKGELGNLDLDGFKFKNVGHVFSDYYVTPKDAGSFSYDILSHGHPLGGTEHGGMESCSRSGLRCSDGEGSDSLCNPGKCVIGKLERVSDAKWRYSSASTYGAQELRATYFIKAEKSVRLKTLLRGNFVTYSENGSPATIRISSPASVASTIYLPPKFYFSEDFLDSFIVHHDRRLGEVARKPATTVSGVKDRKSNFIQSITLGTYPTASEGYVNERLQTSPPEELKNYLLEFFAGLDEPWKIECYSIVEEEYTYRYSRNYTGLEYISVVYDRLDSLFEKVIQVTQSSMSSPRVSFAKSEISRPVYSRLPGLAEAYRSDPAFTDEEKPAQWLTSGVDEFLSKKKESIAAFYNDYLNPDTCDPLLLDWLAQHVGLFGGLWNQDWDSETKRVMIRNAFGWWDRESSVNVPALGDMLTPKGEALSKYPFTNSEWVASESQSNFLSIKLDEIETVTVNNSGNIIQSPRFKVKSFSEESQKLTLSEAFNIGVDKNLWNGLMESKGSLLNVIFLTSTLGIKSHNPLELQFVDFDNQVLKPRSGLRSLEFSAPIQVPYKADVIQVGTPEDASYGNYVNQLVADVSRVSTTDESRNVFFRMPYYYNRDGKSWDRMTYIADNWIPSNLNVRVQYAYLSADLWSVGDAFFELNTEEAE